MIAPQLRRLARPLAELHEDPRNARAHSERNVAAIAASLKEFSQQKPIIALADGTVIAGNGTLRAALSLGWAELAVVTFTDEAKARSYALADNQTALLARWDLDELRDALVAIGGDSAELLAATGFSPHEIANLTAEFPGAAGLTDPDEVPEPPETPTTQRGDRIALGDHVLYCGDSGSTEDVDRLLAGATIQLVNMDPPYNVRVEPRSNNAIALGLNTKGNVPGAHHQGFDLARHPGKSRPTGRMRAKDKPLDNDFMSDEAFEHVLAAWFGNAARVLDPGRSFYVWGGYRNVEAFPRALRATGLYFSQAVIWHKQWPVLTRKDFMGDHEWAFYGWKEGAAHWFNPDVKNATDVWSVKKVTPTSMVHLTEKPVELAERALNYSSRPGENVLDLFGGSGSTLIAAERQGRRAYLMEFDCAYCDVIVERWEKLTGNTAGRQRA
jgi:DNA modification methylase